MGENGKVEAVVCKYCGIGKPLTKEFFRKLSGCGGKYFLKSACRKCLSQKEKDRRKNNPDAYEKRKAAARRSNRKLKEEVINHYGGQCECCGETDSRFLTIDHITGSGRKDREKIKKGMKSGGSYFYRWVRDSGYPDNLRVMCFNCNCGRMVNGGICPHKDNYQGLKKKKRR